MENPANDLTYSVADDYRIVVARLDGDAIYRVSFDAFRLRDSNACAFASSPYDSPISLPLSPYF